MISEKKQEIEKQLNHISGDIKSLRQHMENLTQDFTTQLSILHGVNINGVSVTSFLDDIAIMHDDCGRICTITTQNDVIKCFHFQSIDLYTADDIRANIGNELCFNVIQMLYKTIKNNNEIYLDYKNQMNETLLKISSKKQLDQVLRWALELIISVEKEYKQDEIFYKGYHFTEHSRCVKSFNYEEIYVYGLNFSKNPTGTYSIQLLNQDKSIKAQSTRASEEILKYLIKSFI